MSQAKKIRISKKPDERKQEILDAALELFAQKGYSNTTIQDIAESIGVSQGLCYRYFGSKSELFSAASEHFAFSAIHKVEVPFEEGMTSIQQLDFLLHQMYQYITKTAEFDEIYSAEGKKKVGSEAEMYRLRNFSNQLANVLKSIIKQGMEERMMSCDDLENTSKMLAYGMVFHFHLGVSGEKKKEYAEDFITSLRDIIAGSLHMKEPEKLDLKWLGR